MKSDRGRKGGGGSKELGAGLKYSSRPEVGAGAGGGEPGPSGRGAGRGARALQAPSGRGAGARRQLDGAHLPRFVSARGSLHCPLRPGSWPDRWNFLFGGCRATP